MNKRQMLIALLILVLPVALFASGTQEGGEEVDSLTVYWNANHYYEAYQAVFEEFEEEKGITIDVQNFAWPDMRTKLLTDFSGGTAPDLIEVPAPWVAEFGSKQLLLDITDRVESWPESEDWFDGAWPEVTVDGSIYGMKLHHTCFGFFYNKDLLREAGLPAEAPADLLEFQEYVSVIADELGPEIQGFGFDQDAGYVLNFIMSDDVDTLIDNGEIAIDTPEVREALGILQEVATSGDVLLAEPGASYQSTRRAFIDGKVAMMISGPWDIANLASNAPDMDYGIAMVPHLSEVSNPRVLVAGTAVTMPADSRAPDLVWELIQRLTSLETELAATEEAGMLMPRKSWAQDPTVRNTPKVSDFAQILPSASTFDLGASRMGLSDIMWSGGGGELTMQFYQKLIYGREPAAEALNEYVGRANRQIPN